MSDTDLCYMSASEALTRFEQRTLSPVELMQAVIDRAENVNRKINALTETFYEEGLAKAKAAEAKYATNSTPTSSSRRLASAKPMIDRGGGDELECGFQVRRAAYRRIPSSTPTY